MKLRKNILFLLLMLMIGLPLIQQTIPLFGVKPLKGAFINPVSPRLTLKTYLNGTFQDSLNTWIEHNIGFRPLLVRINNQVAYSVFDTALANGVVIGKQHYLYEINYIKAFRGWDFIGDSAIQDQTRKAVFVTQKLHEAGKTILFILAPGKASFFPEYIPDRYFDKPSGPATNYKAWLKCLTEAGLPVIDFNNWFVRMKDTASYPLYPQCGIHWSAYGVGLAVDSLIRCIEKERSVRMVDFGWDRIDVRNKLIDPDYDIAEGMNLLFTIPHYPMAYPHFVFRNEENAVKPNALVVADSYYWNIFGKGISSRIFSDNAFWYYNVEAHNPQWKSPRKTDGINILDATRNADVIIIMATEANLYRFPYGFIDRVYNALMQQEQSNAMLKTVPAVDLAKQEAEIAEIMKNIDNTPGWKNSVQQKAQKKGIEYIEQLRYDAEWMWEQKHK